MNCKKAAQLIPLFIEADLETAAMQSLTEHLEACDSCRCVAKEFQASQSLLHSVALPEFSENTFVQMRSSVLNEIARPKISDLLHPIWNWKTAFAASLAMIILTSGIVIYRRSTTENSVAQASKISDEKDKNQNPAFSSSGKMAKTSSTPKQILKPRSGRNSSALGEASEGERNPGKNSPKHPSPERATAFDTQIIAESVAPSEANSPNAEPISTITPKPENTEPEMLRIELQTADPNIRIIWFAPKETIAANNKTDLR